MKRLLPVFITFCLLILCNLQHSNLYAQDPELFEHTWYFVTGELDGEIFFQHPEEHIIEVNFSNDEIFLCYPSCDECYSNYVKITVDSFIVSEIEPWIVLIGDCNPPQNEFIDVHNSVYFFSHESSKKTFTYTIDTVDDYYQLTITNGDGDWAVYNSVYLSINDFFKDSFTLYPNPVKETLNINNSSNQAVRAIIYGLNSKLLQSHAIENNTTALDVKSLNQG
ncbi:MAG TPA: T9SS type A sorting domain-containing protein, partial [Flavobacteriaceae bacterium]|nr:T9SS type A sorting domain-containing protein [Flavobacteriaceae bacterium]